MEFTFYINTNYEVLTEEEVFEAFDDDWGDAYGELIETFLQETENDEVLFKILTGCTPVVASMEKFSRVFNEWLDAFRERWIEDNYTVVHKYID